MTEAFAGSTQELQIPPTPNSTSLSFGSVMQSKNSSRTFN
uniref:Uncharacterized protein n=1 Tax=Arundo donax TaxID=35708 RepID=A0A0A9E1R6_ARUDO